VLVADGMPLVPPGQFPLELELEHADFACSSVYGYLSSLELAHLQRWFASLPTQR
jgi:hypothetical protein